MPASSILPSFAAGDTFDAYTIVAKLGEGGFGAVYRVRDPVGNSYAAKMESTRIKTPVLNMEILVLQQLSKGKNRHVCTIFAKGKQPAFKYFVMTLVWKSLQDLRKMRPQQSFSIGTSLRVGRQCLEGIEELHRNGFLHRDVKPGNHAVGRPEVNEQKVIYILDFGLARRYLIADGRFRLPRKRAAFRGTLRYAPIICHRQEEFSPKDDVESWVYMLLEMTKGALPWRAINDKAGVTSWKENVRDAKHTRRHILFADTPDEYQAIFNHLEALTYYQLPNYVHIYGLLRSVEQRMSVTETDAYDWEVKTTHASARPQSQRPRESPSLHRFGQEDEANAGDKTTQQVTKTTTISSNRPPPNTDKSNKRL